MGGRLQIKKNRVGNQGASRILQIIAFGSMSKGLALNKNVVDICLTNSCEALLGLGWTADGDEAWRAGQTSFAISCELEAQGNDMPTLPLLAQSLGQFDT